MTFKERPQNPPIVRVLRALHFETLPYLYELDHRSVRAVWIPFLQALLHCQAPKSPLNIRTINTTAATTNPKPSTRHNPYSAVYILEADALEARSFVENTTLGRVLAKLWQAHPSSTNPKEQYFIWGYYGTQ